MGNKPLKCFACWQEPPKPINLINQRGQCYNCQEKYNRLIYLARCDACQKKIFPKKMNKMIIHDVNPFPVPEISSGLELSKLLKEFVQKKGGQQQIKGWFLFCFDCEKEIKKLSRLEELENSLFDGNTEVLKELEQSGIKLKV